METSPTTDVAKEEILADAEGLKVAMDGVYATMYNRLDFVAANAHQCFGNMAVTLAADLMGDDMVQTAQGAGWFWKDYNYDQRSRYTSKIWRCYFTWKYFYEIISNVNYIISASETATGDENEILCTTAQAYAARAFSYFYADPVLPADIRRPRGSPWSPNLHRADQRIQHRQQTRFCQTSLCADRQRS